MKGSSSDRTKVVLRHLPPSISQAMLMDQIDAAFAGRYHWVAFRPGKSRLGFVGFVIFAQFSFW
jgi:regulator of nonsense transcripts 3